MQRPVFTCFIDISKAYDSADRQLAWKILRKRGAPAKLVTLLADLHDDTESALKADSSKADSWFQVGTGLRQGDVNAPLLFNVYIDIAVKCFQPLIQHLGITLSYKIDGHLVQCKNPSLFKVSWILKYADDIALISDNAKDIKEALDIVDETFREFGLEISVPKTKVMRVCPNTDDNIRFLLRGNAIEEIDQFRYLGTI